MIRWRIEMNALRISENFDENREWKFLLIIKEKKKDHELKLY
jgi:hypothetical protein